MAGQFERQTDRPFTYYYRGRTITNNGEQTTSIKYNTVEGLVKGVSLDGNSAFHAEIKPFFDPAHPRRLYTVAEYLEVLDRICDWFFPQLSREQGREQAGRLGLEGFRKTIFGRVALASIHLIGPERLLKLSPTLFDSAAGVGKRSVSKLGPQQYCFSSRQVSGTFEEEVGLIKAALETAGAQNVRCEVKILALDSWDYFIEWDIKSD